MMENFCSTSLWRTFFSSANKKKEWKKERKEVCKAIKISRECYVYTRIHTRARAVQKSDKRSDTTGWKRNVATFTLPRRIPIAFTSFSTKKKRKKSISTISRENRKHDFQESFLSNYLPFSLSFRLPNCHQFVRLKSLYEYMNSL